MPGLLLLLLINSDNLLFLCDFNCTHYSEYNCEDTKTFTITNLFAFLNMKQYNYVVIKHNKLLDLVMSNNNCEVNRNYVPLFNEDIYYLAISVKVFGLVSARDIFSKYMNKVSFFV